MIDNFLEYGFGVPLRIKSAQFTANGRANDFIIANCKLSLIETVGGKKVVINNSTEFVFSKDFWRNSRYKKVGAVFVKFLIEQYVVYFWGKKKKLKCKLDWWTIKIAWKNPIISWVLEQKIHRYRHKKIKRLNYTIT